MRMWDEGTKKDRAAESDQDRGKGQRWEEMREWGSDGQRCWTSLRCPLSSLLQPPAVGKQILHIRGGGAPRCLCHRNHDDDSWSNFFESNQTMSTSMPPRRPSRDKRTASQGGGGGRKKNQCFCHRQPWINPPAADGDSEPLAYHHGLLPLDPCCAFTTFSLAIEQRGLEKQHLLVVLSSYVHFYVSVLHLILIDFALES